MLLLLFNLERYTQDFHWTILARQFGLFFNRTSKRLQKISLWKCHVDTFANYVNQLRIKVFVHVNETMNQILSAA